MDSKIDSKSTGVRDNKGKLRWRNFPLFLVRPLIEVGHFGEKKYAAFNFLKGLPVLDTMDSMMRHIDAYIDPSKPDYDVCPQDKAGCKPNKDGECLNHSGLHHLALAAWNALVIVYQAKTHPELDNRYSPSSHYTEDVASTPSQITPENPSFENPSLENPNWTWVKYPNVTIKKA
jgi:hypothetical protein